MEYHMEATDLGVILTRMLERWTPRMTRVNITPYFQAEPSCPKVLGDPRALEQVFTNLVSNAVQAMTASGGTLALKMGRSDPVGMQDFVEVSVSDTGPGIPEDIREHIFEPFRTTKPQEGTGLGLAITKRIVTAHKGNISLTTFPGGTVFTVCLPAIHGEYT